MDAANSEEQSYLYSDLIESDNQSSPPILPVRRAFCERCKKAKKMCICDRFKCGVIQNRTKVTILQSSDERNHPIGSARIALLGLENVGLVEVPEIHYRGTFRIRPKVPGSKRCLAGRGGKKHKGPMPLLAHGKTPSDSQLFQLFQLLLNIFDNRLGLLTFDAFSSFMCRDAHAEGKQSGCVGDICQDHDGCMNDIQQDVNIDYMHHRSMNVHDNGCLNDMRQDVGIDDIHRNDDRIMNASHCECMDDMDLSHSIVSLHPRDNSKDMHSGCNSKCPNINHVVCNGMHSSDGHGNNDDVHSNAYSNDDHDVHRNNKHLRGNNAMYHNDKDDVHLHDSNSLNPNDANAMNPNDGGGFHPRIGNDMLSHNGTGVNLCNHNGLTYPKDSNHAISDCDIPGVLHSEVSSDVIEALIPPGVALLFPSDKAIELTDDFSRMAINEELKNHPSHLIVLDGTWPKARRIYLDNPWLRRIPHYKLSPSNVSLYAGVRKEPRPECLSTIESIVFALKALEPGTQGLDGLLEVFDSMVEDQRRCKETKSSILGSWFYKDH